MSMVGFPLLLIPIAIYNIIAFLMPSVSFGDPLVSQRLVSGAEWQVALGDMLVALGVLMLLLEVIKGARPGTKYLTDHLLSLIVFGAAAGEFLMWPKFASSTYFLLTLLAMADFLSGIALRVRRSAQVPATATLPRAAAETVDRSPQEPKFDAAPTSAVLASEAQPAPTPQPASDVDAAASIAESVLMDHPEPKIAQPHVSAREPKVASAEPEIPAPEPEILAPELQPGSGSLAR
jgi:hypothetical protein